MVRIVKTATLTIGNVLEAFGVADGIAFDNDIDNDTDNDDTDTDTDTDNIMETQNND